MIFNALIHGLEDHGLIQTYAESQQLSTVEMIHNVQEQYTHTQTCIFYFLCMYLFYIYICKCIFYINILCVYIYIFLRVLLETSVTA